MATVCYEGESVQIPTWVIDLASFRRWVHSDEFPEKGRICFIQGEVWADMSREQAYSHNQVKAEVTSVLHRLVKTEQIGLFFPDGMRVMNEETGLSAVPDGTFVSHDTFDSGRVRLIEGRDEGFTELEGAPDLVIEIVSTSSEDKDTEWMMKDYWEAGIREYWLIDARTAPLRFDIYRYTAKGYVPTRKLGGWIKSAALGKTFRFTQRLTPHGHPDYTLAAR